MTPDSHTPPVVEAGNAPALALNFSETFPLLKNAPIVEAVIDFRSPASVPFEEASMRERLAGKFTEYPKVVGRRLVENKFTAAAGKPPEATARDLGFIGFECRTADEKQVVQFFKEGFALSRLQPYQNWEAFVSEALRLWEIHRELSQPEEIKRIGVRFINQMSFPLPCERIEDYLTAAPVMPPELHLPLLSTFFHQELRRIPGTPYALNVTKAMQPIEREASHFTLIIDIDVFMAASLRPNDATLSEHLGKMRWLKNKAFFANLTRKAIETFQ